MTHSKNTLNSPDFKDPNFLKKVTARDHEAISVLVSTYTEQLYRAALGLGFDSNYARELVQSVWVTFLDVISGFEMRSHIRTFIFGILYNKALELRRDKKRHEGVDPVEDLLEKRFDVKGNWIKPPVDPEQFLAGAETLDIIEDCLDALPYNQRMAFTLKEIEEQESPDICKILEVSATNLGVLLYRARNRLRECIESKTIRVQK